MRLIAFLIVMALIAPELTSMGRPYCTPEDWMPLLCGSFWWFVLLIVVPLADIVVSAYLAGRQNARKRPHQN